MRLGCPLRRRATLVHTDDGGAARTSQIGVPEGRPGSVLGPWPQATLLTRPHSSRAKLGQDVDNMYTLTNERKAHKLLELETRKSNNVALGTGDSDVHETGGARSPALVCFYTVLLSNMV